MSVGLVFMTTPSTSINLSCKCCAKHDTAFTDSIRYLVCLTIAPAFLSASIYLCLGRLIIVFGQNISRFSPKLYTFTFVLCDVISLVLQAAGGAIAATQDDTDPSETGVNIMIAGLAFQVVSLTLFIGLALDFVVKARKARESDLDYTFMNLRRRTMFRLFPYALALATITIYIRCAFRVAELKDGFGGELANDQGMFMGFEGPMIMVAALALTVCHPGIAFGSASSWQAANWTWKKKNNNDNNNDAIGFNGVEMNSNDTSYVSERGSEYKVPVS